MPSGGISLPVSIAQMGSVAKTQAQGQQAAQQTRPLDSRKEQQEAFKVDKVRETEKTDQGRINPDEERLDKRQKRRLKRSRKRLTGREESGTRFASDHADERPDDSQEELGTLVDCRV
jgi:hypothetical protein